MTLVKKAIGPICTSQLQCSAPGQCLFSCCVHVGQEAVGQEASPCVDQKLLDSMLTSDIFCKCVYFDQLLN